MKQICSSRRSCTELSTFVTDSITPAAPHNGVGQRRVCVCYKQRVVIEFLVADKESVSNINRRLCNVCVRAAG